MVDSTAPKPEPRPGMVTMLLPAVVVLALAATLIVGYRRIQTAELPELLPDKTETSTGIFHLTTPEGHDGNPVLRDLAKRASEAGLSFIVVSDRDAQLAGAMAYHGVTVISAAELDTPFGHVIQLGARGVVDPTARRRLDVLEAVRELDGLPIIAHPADPKRPWNGPVESAGGFEIAHITTALRQRAGRLYLGALAPLIGAAIRPELAAAQFYRRDPLALKRWDATSDPQSVGVCGADRLGLLPPALNLRSWQLVLEEPLDAKSDTSAEDQAVELIRRGRFYCSAALFGERPFFRFGALADERWIARPGDDVSAEEVTELVIFGPEAKPRPPTLALFRNGEEVARLDGTSLRYQAPAPGTYRVEVRIEVPRVVLGSYPATVIYSNRIRLR